MATPYDTIVLDEVTSTQDFATVELAKRERPVLIVASKQTAGRGRTGRDWWQAPCGVAASLAFHPRLFPVKPAFSLAVGLAVRAAIHEVLGVAVRLKWPNDIVAVGGKVGGVLVERDEERVAVGCGLNLWWPHPPETAAALLDHDPGPAVGRAISEAWATLVLGSEAEWDRDEYVACCVTIGAELTWDPDGTGRAISIDDSGGLVVATAHGFETLRSGEVRTIRSSG